MEDRSRVVSHKLDAAGVKGKMSPCQRFVTSRLRLPALEPGYHRLTIESGRPQKDHPPYAALVISAPRRAFSGNATPGSRWGCFLPLYSLRSARNWGAGDFTDLQELARWNAALGGSVVGTLPLLAAFLDDPCEPSPYAPASRLAWNEFYIDVARIPELADCPSASEFVRSAPILEEATRLRAAEYVEYRPIMTLKRRALEMLAESFFAQKPAQRWSQFERFLQAHPHVQDYAAFRAAHERRRTPWPEWPHPQCAGRLSEDDYDARNRQYHLYAQWIATEQIEWLSDVSGGGLYLDLPLGVRPDGYDVWRWRHVYACDSSAGSPPDAVWTKGQDWCFPPLHPEVIREHQYRHFRDLLTHHLRLARLLRIDHVMKLHRLYWIPRGMRADQGCYVRYHPEEFYAILNLESHRCQTTLIGENLGTVPPEVTRTMERHNMQSMYVVQYEVAEPDQERSPSTQGVGAGPLSSAPAHKQRTKRKGAKRPPAVILKAVPPGSLASLNTHDMPTFAAWWRGLDLALRQELELITADEVRSALARQEAIRKELTAWLRSQGWITAASADDTDVLLGILKFLADSEAGVVLVNLEDLWLETQPQNVPGTGSELPNWRRKAAVTLDQLQRRDDILAVLRTVASLRRKPHEAVLSGTPADAGCSDQSGSNS
jgi:4-alpha-glucanotransferase